MNDDEENIRAITEIENALNEKKYGLVWEEHSEKVDEMLEHNIPIFVEDEKRKIVVDEEEGYNFLLEGVIFISIDDNEQAQLKLLCDNIFGEDNFIGEYIKQSKVGGGNDSKFIVKEHEYCKCYSKNIKVTKPMNIKHNEEYLKRYKEEDGDGKYFWDTFARPGLGLNSTLTYEIKAPDGTLLKTRWIRSKERFNREYAEGKIRILKKKNG